MSKKSIPHPNTAKSDEEHLANIALAAEQHQLGHYVSKDIVVTQHDQADGGKRINIGLSRYEK